MRAAAMTLAAVGLAATLAAAPEAAFAQGAGGERGATSEMKGPPNANGRMDDKSMTAPAPRDENPSATNLKGPPNANGFSKQ